MRSHDGLPACGTNVLTPSAGFATGPLPPTISQRFGAGCGAGAAYGKLPWEPENSSVGACCARSNGICTEATPRPGSGPTGTARDRCENDDEGSSGAPPGGCGNGAASSSVAPRCGGNALGVGGRTGDGTAVVTASRGGPIARG